mgnify:CR=1 FL=1
MGEKTKGILQKKVDNQVYEVTHGNDKIFSLPKCRFERLEALKAYVMKECGKSWSQLPREIATLKRQYLRELVRSLE